MLRRHLEMLKQHLGDAQMTLGDAQMTLGDAQITPWRRSDDTIKQHLAEDDQTA